MADYKKHLMEFCDVLEFPRLRQEWIDLFERTEKNWRTQGVDFEELTKDETVLTGLHKASILAETGLVPEDAMGQATDLVVFVLYVWWKKNVRDENPFDAIGEIDAA
jgi:hypothetical protein